MGASPQPQLPSWVSAATARAFGIVAGIRSARALHPRGVTFTGDATVHAAGRPLCAEKDAAVVVRLSRGIGLPAPWPDFNGVAVRFLDAHGPARHQDVLVTESLSAPLLRHVIVPWPSFDRLGFSSVVPFETDGGRRMLRVDPLDVATLERADAELPTAFELRIASTRGPWLPAATVRLRRALDPDAAADVRFDPWTTVDTLRPVGVLNALRRPAYIGSRDAAPRAS